MKTDLPCCVGKGLRMHMQLLPMNIGFSLLHRAHTLHTVTVSHGHTHIVAAVLEAKTAFL